MCKNHDNKYELIIIAVSFVLGLVISSALALYSNGYFTSPKIPVSQPGASQVLPFELPLGKTGLALTDSLKIAQPEIKEYEIEIIRIIDGDTVAANINLGLNVYIVGAIRLAGIDAPEMKDKDGKGIRAKEHLTKLLDYSKIILRVNPYRYTDKYGRYLGWLYSVSNNSYFPINEQMIMDGFAVKY